MYLTLRGVVGYTTNTTRNGVQIPVQICVLLLHSFVFTEEPIGYSIQMGDKEQALKAIKTIFSRENSLTHEIIYTDKLEQH